MGKQPIPIPQFCDFDCPHADFAPAETAGLCRTMSAVWCRKLKELVNKNLPCAWRRRQLASAATEPKGRRRAARGGRAR